MSVKLKSLIVGIVVCLVFAGAGIGIYCAWPAITGVITDSSYYTSKDVQDAYDKGYDDAFKNKTELEAQIEYYKGLTDQYYISILEYQKQIKDYETQNSKLQATISSLNEQVSSLKTLVSNLQSSNETNLETIVSLNNQIVLLNNQIVELTNQVQNNSSVVNNLNAKIAQLEKSIAYYEDYISQLENGEQVVATFEFDGCVYNIQILNKGGKVSVVDPTSTEYVIFNGWTVDGQPVELSTYVVNKNTKFVADVTYKYAVTFMVDGQQYGDIQVVDKDGTASLPTAPTKDDYKFKYWTLGGIQVDVTTYKITASTIFIAEFSKMLNAYTWTEISAISSSGKAQDYFQVGDKKSFKFTHNGQVHTLNAVIADLNRHDLPGIVFVLEFPFKESYLSETQISSYMEESLASVLKEVQRPGYGGSVYNTKAFMLRIAEVYNSGYSQYGYDPFEYFTDQDFSKLSDKGQDYAFAFADYASGANMELHYSNGQVSFEYDAFTTHFMFGFCI